MKLIFFWILLLPAIALGQIRGKVTDPHGKPIQGATISLNGTYLGTSSNADGAYEIRPNKAGPYTLTVYNLGYETAVKNTTADGATHTLDFILSPLVEQIEEVVISNRENPADRIIRQAIKHKKSNGKKYDRYHVEFYSKGVMKLIDMPKKILGKRVDEDKDLMDDLMLDSTRSGIVYLSETISEVWFERPNKFKEVVKASKVSGNDQGYSFNTARGANFDFYSNYIAIFGDVISPIADQAFAYYRFQLEQSFESGDHLIHRIKVLPKRTSERVGSGHIYIIDDTYEIYAVDLSVKGSSINTPVIDSIRIQQQYVYHGNDKMWLKQSQHLAMALSIFSIKIGGQFDHVFNNYQFRQNFEKGTFGRTMVKVEEESNKQSADFWLENRPFVLKEEEQTNYVRKDSLQRVRQSPAYLDSLDRIGNKFNPTDVLTSYTYTDRARRYRMGYTNVFGNLDKTTYNAVQGFVANFGLHASKWSANEIGRTAFSTNFHYGFSDEKIRFSSLLTHRFRSRKFRALSLSGGSNTAQFNSDEPIAPVVNMAASLFFKENLIKLYQRDYVRLNYNDMLIPGLQLHVGLEWNRRSPLFVRTNYSFFKNDELFPSNNPLNPEDYDSAPIERHRIAKWNLALTINPGQQIIDRPDGIFYVNNRHMPTFKVAYEQGFASAHNFQKIAARIRHDISLNNKGELNVHLKGGLFFDGDQMTFVDFQHFNGNQTHIGTSKGYMDQFMLLPYYANSTNKRYFETHTEYNFKGFILNKIPLLNRLGFEEIIGHHHLSVPGRPSYNEFSVGLNHIGWGKFRPFRIDYVKSFQGDMRENGFVLGLKFLSF